MITDTDLIEAIRGAIAELDKGEITTEIASRDIRNACKQFDNQPTIRMVQAHDINLADMK